MVKIPISSTKYIIIGNFNVDGLIDKTDLIGAFFGQTEGLIGEDLEFTNLQKNGKLGRIDIQLKKIKNKTKGKFFIPTALNKSEVSLVAAAIESINKIGHTNGIIQIKEIKDERKEKRDKIIKRAEKLLENLREDLPNSNNIIESIDEKIKVKHIKKYGRNYFGGPNIRNEREIILVEGRADVVNLIKNGISNVVSFNGTKFDDYIIRLIQNKDIILFLDDDNAGYKHLEELKSCLNIKYYTFAPDGKEVENLSLKEINKSLKNKKIINKPKIISKVKKIFKKKQILEQN